MRFAYNSGEPAARMLKNRTLRGRIERIHTDLIIRKDPYHPGFFPVPLIMCSQLVKTNIVVGAGNLSG